MAKFTYIVSVECETRQQADTVMAARTCYDEELEEGFDYRLTWTEFVGEED